MSGLRRREGNWVGGNKGVVRSEGLGTEVVRTEGLGTEGLSARSHGENGNFPENGKNRIAGI